jgi:cation diffusion facilitator family transporter
MSSTKILVVDDEAAITNTVKAYLEPEGYTVYTAANGMAAFITFLAVRFSDKPADAGHTYGHGKIENLSALVETLLLFITCAWIIYEALQRLVFHSVDVDPSIWAFLCVTISIVVDVNRSRMLYAAARKHHSQALEADALHFSTDIWSSAVVLLGLGVVWLGENAFPDSAYLLVRADAVAALGVAVIVIGVSYRLGKRTVDVLLDRAPDGLPGKIAEAAAGADGVLNVGQVRVRRSGPRAFVDLNVSVDRNLPFERSHAIADAVELAVQCVAPDADVVVHTDPEEYERETLADRIRAVASMNQMAVHNIGVHAEHDGTLVDLHLEVDDHLDLEHAHRMSQIIEREIGAGIPGIGRVNVHIEARGTGVGNGKDVTVEQSALVARIQAIADEVMGSPRCHALTLRQLDDKFTVALHCTFNRSLPVAQVHDISTRIELRLQESIPNLQRVLVHAEPDRAGPEGPTHGGR